MMKDSQLLSTQQKRRMYMTSSEKAALKNKAFNDAMEEKLKAEVDRIKANNIQKSTAEKPTKSIYEIRHERINFLKNYKNESLNKKQTKKSKEDLKAKKKEAVEPVSKQSVVEKPSKARLKYEEILTNLRNPVKKSVRTQKITNVLTSILRAVIIIGLAFVIVFPIFQQITLAFRHPSDVQNPLVIWIPEKWSILNFKIAFRLLDYNVSLWNNIKVSFVCMIGQIFCSVLAGYTFARLKFKGSNIIFIILLMTFIIPPQAVSVSRMLYFAHFDILGIIKLFNHGNTISLSGKRIILYIMSFSGQGINSAIFIFLFRQFFRGVPVELEESAEIDGAGVFRTFWSVMLPNARGVMITVALFSFVWQWNDVYYTSLLAISTNSFPMLTMRLKNTAEWLPSLMKLYKLESLVDSEIRGNALFTALIANTAGFMMCLPLLIGYLFVQKLFVEGIERTGIVG